MGAFFFSSSILFEISLISSVASPALVMHTEAAGTSIPVDVPSCCLWGTKTYGILCSSQSMGRCATTSGGSTSSAMTTSFACPLSIALVVSFVPLHVVPVCVAICRAS